MLGGPTYGGLLQSEDGGEMKAWRVTTGDLRANRYFPRTDMQKVSHAEKRPTSEPNSSVVSEQK